MGASDGSVIFAFLILFLGLFGVFLFGGLVWHYVRATRHAMLLSSLIRSEHEKTWSAGKPVLRDVHVNTPRACLGNFEYDLVSSSATYYAKTGMAESVSSFSP
jgi:hypothetical protein